MSESGSILDVHSSKHIISASYSNILKKFMICFSPFDKFDPDNSILKSKLIFAPLYTSNVVSLPDTSGLFTPLI